MSEQTVAFDTTPVRAFGRQMARELSATEFDMVSEAQSPSANPEIGVMSSGWVDPPAC